MFLFVYITTNLINNKQYVGKHINESINDNYLGSGQILNKAINKYSKNNFKREILEICSSEEELNEKEIYWIVEKNTLHPNGYNLTSGGTGGDTFTCNPNKEKIRKNRSAAIKKYWDNLSKEDKKIRISKIKGKKRSEESKKRYSKAKKGYKMSEVHKERMIKSVKLAKKGKPTYNQRKINMFDLEMNFIQFFESIQEASKKTGHNASTICKICKGKKDKVKNHIFKYANTV